MFKYFIRTSGETKPITYQEYTNYIITDAIDNGETSTTGLRVVKENHQEARHTDKSVFTLTGGAEAIIIKDNTK